MPSQLQQTPKEPIDKDSPISPIGGKVTKLHRNSSQTVISLQQLAADLSSKLPHISFQKVSGEKARNTGGEITRLKSELQVANEQLKAAQREFTTLQSADGEDANDLHLRVLKELAGQQQEQLMQLRQLQKEVALLVKPEGEADDLEPDLPALCAKVRSSIEQKAVERQSALDFKEKANLLTEELKVAKTALMAREEDCQSKEIALAEIESKNQSDQKRITSQNQELEAQNQHQKRHLSELQTLQTALNDAKSLCDEKVKERKQQEKELLELRKDLAKWQTEFQERVSERVNEEIKNSFASNQGTSAPKDGDSLSENAEWKQQFGKAKILLIKSSQNIEELKKQLLYSEREKSASLNRAGLMQNRLEEHFKVNQQLKRQLLGLQQQAMSSRQELQSQQSEVEELRQSRETWALQRLELQKELVDQAQERADAKQEVGKLLAKERELNLALKEQQWINNEHSERIEQLSNLIGQKEQAINHLLEQRGKELATQRQLEEAAKSANAQKSAETLKEQVAQLQALQRQNEELQQQLGQSLKVIDQQREKESDLLQSGQQTQKMIHQLVEQMREKDARAQMLQRQLHKKTKDTVSAQEQLTKNDEEMRRLRELLKEHQQCDANAKELKKELQVQSNQLSALSQALQRAESKSEQFEELGRNYAQLQQLLSPLRNALGPAHSLPPFERPTIATEGDLFQTDSGASRIKSELFDQLS